MAVFRGERTAWRYSHRLFANRSPPPMLRPVTLLCCFAAGSEARIDAMNRHVITRCRNRIGRSRAGRLDISICYASGNTRNREARYLRTVVRINCVLYPYQSINYHYHYHYHYHTIYLSQIPASEKPKTKKTKNKIMQAPFAILIIFAAAAAALALPRPQDPPEVLPRCRSQLNYLLCLETCVLPGTVECPDRCCE